jgi:hypothetical protein
MNAHIVARCAAFAVMLGGCAGQVLAQAPTATGRCVLNCDAPLSPSRTAPAPANMAPMMNQLGNEMGRAVGSGLFNTESNARSYDDPSVQSARSQLEQWAHEEDDPGSARPAQPQDRSDVLRRAAPSTWACYPPADNGRWLQCADERGHRRCLRLESNGAVYEVSCTP